MRLTLCELLAKNEERLWQGEKKRMTAEVLLYFESPFQ